MRAFATNSPETATGKNKKPEVRPVSLSPRSIQPATVFDGRFLQRQPACACGGGCPRCHSKLPIQTKLAVSEPGDMYEQEADRVAKTVMRMPAPALQRACASCSAVGAPCPRCEAEEKGLIQKRRAPLFSQPDVSVPDSFLHDLGPGHPLDAATRTFMESPFGHDFSQVRVHTNERAAELARAVNALAYTVGRDIVFGTGQFSPQTTAGRRLLAHELTHTIQQGAVSSTYGSAGMTNPNSLQREPDDEEPTAELAETAMPDEELLPEPADEETFVVGNTMDLVSGDSPAELALASPENIPKAPEGKDKTKMGGPLGPVREGLGKPKAELSPECKEWIKLKRTTYAYDPGKDVDPLEKEFLEKYKDFKEGVPIAKPGDFNVKLKAATANPCTCMENLQVDGHGGSWSGGAQEFAPRKFKTLGERSFGVKQDKDGKIVPYNFEVFDGIKFCKPCSITLGGCYVALNEPKAEAGASGFKGAGDALGKALAAKTGCSVTAYTDLTTTPKAGEFKGGAAGKWVTTEPEKSGK